MHVCITGDDGILVLDACPTRADFEGFSSNPDTLATSTSAGLPQPRIEPLGRVHDLLISDRVLAS